MDHPVLGGRREQGRDDPDRFELAANVNRQDFGVSWNDKLPGSGVVVSNEIKLKIDVEAILDDDLRTVGLEQAVYPG